jgi:hypothetical protein
VGRTYDRLDERLRTFLERQPVFFVATAPRGDGGHVNVSPKGIDGTFVVLDDEHVGYLDLTGSGVETLAHLRDNGRITVMFCAFEGPPRIVRLFGRGEAVTRGDARFDDLVARFPKLPGTRSVILVTLDRIADSCGYGVPRMDFVEHRDRLLDSATKTSEEGLVAYRRDNNALSIDGLPGIDA